MIENGVFVTIHGIDGTGKTTTAAEIQTLLNTQGFPVINYDVYEKEHLQNPFALSKKQVIAEASPEAQFAYYLGSTLYHGEQIRRLTEQGFMVVKSRYLDDVLAHHAHLGVENTVEIAKLLPILQPDLKVILTLPEAIRRQRIVHRGEIDEKDKEVRKTGSRLNFFENFLLRHNELLLASGQAVRIDTSILEPIQVAERIASSINHRRIAALV